MNEEGAVQNQDTSAPITQNNVQTEKMLSQSEVNDIVGRAKSEAANRAIEQYKRSQESSYNQSQQEQYKSQPAQILSEERYRQLAAEEATRLRDQWMNDARTQQEQEMAKKIVQDFWTKIDAGKSKYEDFDKVTSDMSFDRFPNTVHMLSQYVDNPSDVLYELAKNRAKMAQIEMTARDFPQEALYDLKRLGESIKANAQAQNYRQPNAPLSQQRPSTMSADASDRPLSMPDLKRKYRV